MGDGSSNEDELYLYLDFGANVKSELFETPVHLQIANLHKENPLVQLNDRLFKGTFDHAVGTNMFFESCEAQIKPNAYSRKAPFDLNYITSQNKVLNLVPVKIKPKKPELPEKQLQIQYNLKWDYATLLKKWDDGSLELNDLLKGGKFIPAKEKVKDASEDERDNEDEEDSSVESEPPEEHKKKTIETDKKLDKELQIAYDKLQLLAQRPVKRKTEEERVQECEDKYKKSYELHNIQRQVLQPSDAFRNEIDMTIEEETLSEHVDINRCVLYGILKPSSAFPRILTSEEKKVVFSLDNFDNLSLSGRFFVINDFVNKLEQQLENMSDDILLQRDKFGRTPVETLEIYKGLRDCLSREIAGIKLAYCDDTVA